MILKAGWTLEQDCIAYAKECFETARSVWPEYAPPWEHTMWLHLFWAAAGEIIPSE